VEKLAKSARVIEELRSLGRGFLDKGMLEVDLATGQVRWANDFFLSKTGFDLQQIERMSIFDIVPEAFHKETRERLQNNRPPKFSIFPTLASNGKIVWWFLTPVRQEHSIDWTQGDFVQVTERDDQAFSFMRFMMVTTNSYGELHGRIDGMVTWVKGEIARIDRNERDQDDWIRSVEEKAIEAARSAAKSADEVRGDVKGLKEEFTKAMDVVRSDQAEHAAEILKLIVNDADFKKRQDEMSEHIKKVMTEATGKATQAMTEATGKATQAITIQATKEGRSLSRKVVFPTALVTAVVTLIANIVQYLLNGR
jgi:hypothetical protein